MPPVPQTFADACRASGWVLLRLRRRRPGSSTRPKPSTGRSWYPHRISGVIRDGAGSPKPPRWSTEPLAPTDRADPAKERPIPARQLSVHRLRPATRHRFITDTPNRCRRPFNWQAWNCATSTTSRRVPHPRGQATAWPTCARSPAEAMPPGWEAAGRHLSGGRDQTESASTEQPDLANCEIDTCPTWAACAPASHPRRPPNPLNASDATWRWVPPPPSGDIRRMATTSGRLPLEQQLTSTRPYDPTGRGNPPPSDTADLPFPSGTINQNAAPHALQSDPTGLAKN